MKSNSPMDKVLVICRTCGGHDPHQCGACNGSSTEWYDEPELLPDESVLDRRSHPDSQSEPAPETDGPHA